MCSEAGAIMGERRDRLLLTDRDRLRRRPPATAPRTRAAPSAMPHRQAARTRAARGPHHRGRRGRPLEHESFAFAMAGGQVAYVVRSMEGPGGFDALAVVVGPAGAVGDHVRMVMGEQVADDRSQRVQLAGGGVHESGAQVVPESEVAVGRFGLPNALRVAAGAVVLARGTQLVVEAGAREERLSSRRDRPAVRPSGARARSAPRPRRKQRASLVEVFECEPDCVFARRMLEGALPIHVRITLESTKLRHPGAVRRGRTAWRPDARRATPHPPHSQAPVRRLPHDPAPPASRYGSRTKGATAADGRLEAGRCRAGGVRNRCPYVVLRCSLRLCS
jgi:hypothetical protein